MNEVGVIEDGALAVVGSRIAAVGPIAEVAKAWDGPVREFPSSCIVPGLVDSHTHPIFCGSRADEFVKRAQGATYEEIHAAGGGIAKTVRETRAASDEELAEATARNLKRMLRHGTTTVEAKSGYGLQTSEELRELRVLRQLNNSLPLDICSTFMGAHDIPEEYKGRADEYLNLVIEDMMPLVKADGLADWIDIFCERNVFSLEQSHRLLEAGSASGFGLRIHAEEFCHSGAAVMAARLGARSVDHLLHLQPEDFSPLRETDAICTLMPGTSFFLGEGHYAPGRAMLDADLRVALASDFNAGSTMGCSMQMSMSLAVLRLKFTPAEALVAATVNSAHSLNLGDTVGSLEQGKQADFLVLDSAEWQEWPYLFGVNLVAKVFKCGQEVAHSAMI